MISMSSQSRPNQKKRDFEKDIVFFGRLLDQKEREKERERSLGKKKIDRLPKKKKKKKLRCDEDFQATTPKKCNTGDKGRKKTTETLLF